MKKNFIFLISLFTLHFFCQGQKTNSNTLLWRIDSKNNEEPSYLFGTIHLPQKKFVHYSDSVYAAIQNTQLFYNEIDFLNFSLFRDPSMMSFMEEKVKHLDSLQKTDNWKKMVDKINRKYGIHLNYDSTDQFVEFSQQFMSSFYESDEGMSIPDAMLAGHASMLGKKTGGLETHQFQFNMLYDIIDARVSDTTIEFEDEVAMLSSMKKFYADEQLDSLGMMIEQMHPTYKELVFDRRNKTMADSIEKHCQAQPSFFAIGAGHLGGRKGVIAVLQKKGFTVSPVHSNNKISMLVINDMMKMMQRAKKNNMVDEGVSTMGIEDIEAPPPPPMDLLGPKIKIEESKSIPVKKKTKKKS